MQIETLRLFCDLVETGSFSLAAVKHHVSQSAVSQRIPLSPAALRSVRR